MTPDTMEKTPAPPEKPVWKVLYSRGFFPRRGRERSGAALPIEKRFHWAGFDWYVPAAYACSKGLVIDFCISAAPEAFKAFWDKWTDENGQERRYTEEEQLQIALDNPLDPQFHASVLLNGRTLSQRSACGQSYLPPSCQPEQFGDGHVGQWLVEHYNLDAEKCWVFRRVCLPWATKRKPKLRSLTLTLSQDPLAFPGPHFQVNGAGDTVSFTHPLSGKEHLLTVAEYEQQEMDTACFGDQNMEYPTHYTAMTYALQPDLPQSAVSVQDCARSDRPRPKQVDPMAPKAVHDVILAAVGGADGPTAFFLMTGSKPHSACSSLSFAQRDQVEWRITIHEKTAEDLTLTIL